MSKLLAALAAVLVASVAIAQTTLTVPPQSCTAVVTCQGVQVTLPASAPVVVPPVIPPAAGTLWLYHNGVFSWGGDYSWGITVNYADTAGKPVSGTTDIAVTGIGGFQPFAPGFDFDPSPYKYLTFSLKPTIAAQTWQSHFYAVGDIPMGALVDVLKFGPAPQAGVWGTYKIPLGTGGYQLPADKHVYKFMIQDQTADQGGFTTNKWYVDEIRFTAQ